MALADLKVHLVDDIDKAQEFLRWLGERHDGSLAVDAETTGLHWWTPGFLRMVQFGDADTGWSIPFEWWGGVVRDALSRYDGELSMHNAPFDMHSLESGGLEIPPWRKVQDTKVRDHLLDSGKSHSLKPLAARLWGDEAKAGQNMLKSDMTKHGWTWATVPYDWPAYWAYAALDTVLTARVENHHRPLISALYQGPYDREMAVQEIIFNAEKRGMLLDVEYTRNLAAQWEGEMGELQTQLEAYGIQSPNANAQIEAALRARDPEWEPDEWTDSGQAKMDKDVLIKLGNDLGRLVLKYRRLRKWKKVYLDKFLELRDVDDRLHPSVNTLGARTGRMTMNLFQTLPRGNDIRNCIKAGPGNSLLSIDFDTMEYRGLAHYADAPVIKQAIADGTDLHKLTASLAYTIPMETVSKQQRQISKNTAYGRMYGAGAAKIAVTASAPDTDGSFTVVTEQEVATFLERYDAKMPEVARFMEAVQEVGKQRLNEEGQAYIMTSGGRRVTVDADRLYAGVNYLIQGSCADIFKNKIVEIANAGLDQYIMLPVHDELLFEVPTDQFDDLAPELERLMADLTTFSVPLTVGASAPLERWSK